MKKSSFTEDQIVGVLKEHEAGLAVAEAMLDNAALKDLLGKNGDARRTSGGRVVSTVGP